MTSASKGFCEHHSASGLVLLAQYGYFHSSKGMVICTYICGMDSMDSKSLKARPAGSVYYKPANKRAKPKSKLFAILNKAHHEIHNFSSKKNLGWRVDIGMYESVEYGYIYTYRVWVKGVVITKTTIGRFRPKSAKLMTSPNNIGVWIMGKEEFEKGDCKGNKWSVPVNRVLNLSHP
jgi:hypothetical protein